MENLSAHGMKLIVPQYSKFQGRIDASRLGLNEFLRQLARHICAYFIITLILIQNKIFLHNSDKKGCNLRSWFMRGILRGRPGDDETPQDGEMVRHAKTIISWPFSVMVLFLNGFNDYLMAFTSVGGLFQWHVIRYRLFTFVYCLHFPEKVSTFTLKSSPLYASNF